MHLWFFLTDYPPNALVFLTDYPPNALVFLIDYPPNALAIRRGGGGADVGWGPLGRPASCSPAASPLPPMGDASVPTPLRPSPAPTTVTIRPKKPTVERGEPPVASST